MRTIFFALCNEVAPHPSGIGIDVRGVAFGSVGWEPDMPYAVYAFAVLQLAATDRTPTAAIRVTPPAGAPIVLPMDATSAQRFRPYFVCQSARPTMIKIHDPGVYRFDLLLNGERSDGAATWTLDFEDAPSA